MLHPEQMGIFDNLDRHTTRKPADDFDKPLFQTGAGRMAIAIALFVIVWALIAVVMPALFAALTTG